MTSPSSWDVVALADMMISQDPGGISCSQKAILDKCGLVFIFTFLFLLVLLLLIFLAVCIVIEKSINALCLLVQNNILLM